MKFRFLSKMMACTMVGSMLFVGCGSNESTEITTETVENTESYSNDEDGGHAIEVSGEEATYENITVTKTGVFCGTYAQ